MAARQRGRYASRPRRPFARLSLGLAHLDLYRAANCPWLGSPPEPATHRLSRHDPGTGHRRRARVRCRRRADLRGGAVISRALQISLGFAVSALAMFYLLQQVSLEQVGQVLGRAQALPIVLIVTFVMGSLITRAARWQTYFLPRRRVPFSPLLATLAISYMASTFLPLRAGELVRAVFLGQRQRLPVPGIVGTILLEKLFDFLAIGVMVVILLTLTSLPPAAQVAGASIAGVILVGFGFVVALAVWRAPTLRFVGVLEHLLPFDLG